MNRAKKRPPPGGRLTHVDRRGRARMVDISAKPDTARRAVARGLVRMQASTLALVRAKRVAKGDVLTVAQLAGIMAAKRAAELIPLCHPIPLTHAEVELVPDAKAGGVAIEATVDTTAPTGVEMEALVAVAVAALTVYDMCKAADCGMTIERVRLVHKRGGRSGTYTRRGEAS